MSNDNTARFETEGVIVELENEADKAKCKLKPVVGASSVEIGGTKYLVGRYAASSDANPACAKCWTLNEDGVTNEGFEFDTDLAAWALAAWQAQRKVRVVVGEKDDKSYIVKITLL